MQRKRLSAVTPPLRAISINTVGLMALICLISFAWTWLTKKSIQIIPSPSTLIRSSSHYEKEAYTNCLNMEEVERALSSADQTFILMPAKASGTSLKAFTKKCMNGTASSLVPNLVVNSHKYHKPFLQSNMKPPKLITSHVYKAETLIEIAESIDPTSLMIYVYRNELDRLKSAIAFITNARICSKKNFPELKETFAKDMTADSVIFGEDGKCTINEDFLLTIIEEKFKEISLGGNRILTCNTYESLKRTDPTMIFVHYKQSSVLQKLLANHHCPELNNTTVQSNVAQNENDQPYIYSSQSQSTVRVKEWAENKGPLLQWTLGLTEGEGVQCQRKTHQIQREIHSCPSEMIRLPIFLD